MVAARLFNKTDSGALYEALMQGVANSQTVWLFEQAGVPLPRIRADVRPTVAEACLPPLSVTPDRPMGEALDLLHEHAFSLVPVASEEGRFLGAVGFSLPEARYLTHFNMEDFLGSLVTIEELARGLDLVAMNPAATTYRDPAESSPAAFRLYPGGGQVNAGDLILTGANAAAVTFAAEAGASAVVFADCAEAEVRRWSQGVTVPIYRFAGSLMALVNQLPRAIPVGRLMSPSVPTVQTEDVLEDLRPIFARTAHALPVLDGNGHLCGMISRREALQPPRRGLVLVDHFERTQTVRGWENTEILQIIDHHRVGGLETVEPARVDCRPLGSTASILALRYIEAGIEPDEAEATLLLGALVADTLLLTSPTTTAKDREIARQLTKLSGLDLPTFGREVLARNDGLATDSASALVTRDLKAFSHGEVSFLLGQIETVDLSLLDASRARDLRKALDEARGRAGAAFAVTMVTDVLRGVSAFLMADADQRRMLHLFENADPLNNVEYEMVSRKKQLVPLVMARLATYKS